MQKGEGGVAEKERRKKKAVGSDRIYFERFGAGGTSTSVFLIFVIR